MLKTVNDLDEEWTSISGIVISNCIPALSIVNAAAFEMILDIKIKTKKMIVIPYEDQVLEERKRQEKQIQTIKRCHSMNRTLKFKP
jgi:hypothetical protein